MGPGELAGVSHYDDTEEDTTIEDLLDAGGDLFDSFLDALDAGADWAREKFDELLAEYSAKVTDWWRDARLAFKSWVIEVRAPRALDLLPKAWDELFDSDADEHDVTKFGYKTDGSGEKCETHTGEECFSVEEGIVFDTHTLEEGGHVKEILIFGDGCITVYSEGWYDERIGEDGAYVWDEVDWSMDEEACWEEFLESLGLSDGPEEPPDDPDDFREWLEKYREDYEPF